MISFSTGMLFTGEESLDIIAGELKKKAELIKGPEPLNNLSDITLRLRFWFSNHYKIPMKSPLLDEYTLPEMYLEYFLHTNDSAEEKQKTSAKSITDNREEIADGLFAEFEEPEYTPAKAPLSSEENAFMDQMFKPSESWTFKEEE